MHPWILGAGLCLLGATAQAAASDCPRAGAPVTERFISADCADCWAAAGSAAAPAAGWLFDWITPTPAGSEAALATAAPPEAQERALRAGGPSPVAAQMLTLRSALPSAVPKLRVLSGPAWNGYFGLQLELSGRVPPGSSGWLALVELLPAGSEGSAIERQLVRQVAGPLPLDSAKRPLSHLRALRWPESAQPTRLQARGWIEAPDGRLLAIASDRCPSR
ncbi:hypothetical protein HLB44_28345 [Aquincola sp. S2]|uniref:Uncharacterized protein n=1 Tax=Pseudaquabacterium terrae TaxID=2732868 RepID=A0ABX2EQE0_9BURK|nr:hypothetical protein [Aquabacterium terrae]NRF70922.1 hypothetical protein [Aquabacterium terrae]